MYDFVRLLSQLCLVMVMINVSSSSLDGEYNDYDSYKSSADFENFDNVSGAPSGANIVPNIVHFIRFGKKNMSFIEAVCVLAALKNQRPKKLMIHTDHLDQGGKYWEVVTKHDLAQGVLEVKFRPPPTSIFGHELSLKFRPFHAGDVARLKVLMEFGGIFLDGDSYVVKNLDDFRKFEMTLGWTAGGGISNQVIITNKHARFLTEWYNSYIAYVKDKWVYNAADLPTEILEGKPHLIHRVTEYMAEWIHTRRMVFLNRSNEWTKHYVIHLRAQDLDRYLRNNGRTKGKYQFAFNEYNILKYDANIKDMAMAVYPYPDDITSAFL